METDFAIEPIGFTPKEIAKVLRVSNATVMRLVFSGDVQSFRVGRQHRIPIEQPYFQRRKITRQHLEAVI
jgi:excisionase family DNA binding protein